VEVPVAERSLYSAEGLTLTLLLGALALWLFAGFLGRNRPGLNLRWLLLVGFFLRVVAAGALNLTSFGAGIRGGDEVGFLLDAHELAGLPFLSKPWLGALVGHFHLPIANSNEFSGSLHVFLMALQIRLFGASEMAMRTTMAAISVIGLGLIAAAAYELAGQRAARIVGWLLVVEPANVFFSTALHKEPTLFLAEGMVAFGGALLWRRARLMPVALMVAGCLIALATRPYAGWFLGAGSALVVLHAALRAASSRTFAAVILAALVALAAAVSTPAIVQATSKQDLTSLQYSQHANAVNLQSNLALPAVNFSSRTEIIKNLPGRIFDLMFRPFPWQLGDISQQLGALETLFVLAVVGFLVRLVAGGMRSPMRIAAPLIYPAFMLIVAYSLAVGNAGTGFRYRTQVMALLIAITVVLRERAPARVRSRSRSRARGPALRVSAGSDARVRA
jgi:hypothetical protein